MQAKRKKPQNPASVRLLGWLLIIEALLIIVLTLNMLFKHWVFIISWRALLQDFQAIWRMIVDADPGSLSDERIIYALLAVPFLFGAAFLATFCGLTFSRRWRATWGAAVFTQVSLLTSSVLLYFFFKPTQAYVMMLIGIIMTLLLNNGAVKATFLKEYQQPPAKEVAP